MPGRSYDILRASRGGPRLAATLKEKMLMSVPFKVDLSGKVAVVTGATGVLCGAMARALGDEP